MNGKTVRPEGRTIEEVCHRLLDDINRWSPEVQTGIRSTLWHGVFTKAHQQVEVLLKTCASTMVAEAGDAGPAAVAAVGGGKPIAAMTMGKHVDLVRRLGSDLFGGEDLTAYGSQAPDLTHLDRWVGVLARVAGVSAAA